VLKESIDKKFEEYKVDIQTLVKSMIKNKVDVSALDEVEDHYLTNID